MNVKVLTQRWFSATILGIGLILLVPVPGVAALIDFESIGTFTPTAAGDVVPVPGSVITNEFQADGVLFGRAGVSAGVAVVRDSLAPSSGLNTAAGLNAAGIIPGTALGGTVGDIYFDFVVPSTTTPATTDLASFTIGDDGGDLDEFIIRAFDLSDLLISSQAVSGVSRFPVSIGVAGIHRVEIDFSGDFGYTLDDLRFNTPTAVPEPAILALLGLGLAGVGFLRRRKQ